MQVSGFPDIIRTTLFDRTTVELRQDMTIAAEELVTGQRSDLTEALAGNAGQYNLVTKALADLDSAQARHTLAENRLVQTDLALNVIRASTEGFAEQAVAELSLGGTIGRDAIQDTARSLIGTTVSALNVNNSGRNLFSGEAVDSAPFGSVDDLYTAIDAAIGGATDSASIDAAISSVFAAGGAFDTTVYGGAVADAASIKLTSGTEVDFNVRADDQAIKDTLEGLIRIAYAPDDAGSAWADSASSKLSTGENRLIALQADIGRQRSHIDTANELAEQEKLILNETQFGLAGVDSFEAASRLQALETQLNAAYTVTARLSQLSFTNFL